MAAIHEQLIKPNDPERRVNVVHEKKWTKPRPVVAKAEWYAGGLYSRVGLDPL